MTPSNEASKFRVALIIPALNEEPVIGRTLALVPAGMFYVVVVADNGSTDRTAEIARAAGAMVTQSARRGYGFACMAALAALPPEIEAAVYLQADGSEDPRDAERLLAPLRSGEADLVIGVREAAVRLALLPHQRFGNWLAVALIRLLYGYRYADLGPFRAIRLDALRGLRMSEGRYGWTVEMQVRALEEGLRVREVPVRYGVRVAGENKISGNLRASVAAGWTIVTTILKLRFRG